MGLLAEFLNQYSSNNTIKTYKTSLRRFFEVIYGEKKSLEGLVERYFSEKRDYEQDVTEFFAFIKDKPPKSRRTLFSCVKTFLIENGIEIAGLFWRKLMKKAKGTRARTIDKIPSNTQLKRIITHMPINGKALFLVLSSSGMRIGESLVLKPGDIDLNSDPVKISIRGEYTKSGNPRIVFISNEAKEYLVEWQKHREQYLKVAAKRSTKHKKTIKDDRVFPFTHALVSQIWNRSLKKSNLAEKDSSTNRHKIHIHTLRKFFRTQLGKVIPVDMVEALMGHEEYLTEVYRHHSLEDLAKYYKEGEHVLTIFSNIEKVSELKKEIEQKNNELQTLVNGLTMENIRLKEELRSSNKRLSSVEAKIQELYEMAKKIDIKKLDRLRDLSIE